MIRTLPFPAAGVLRPIIYWLLALSLAAAVFLKAGVVPSQFAWSALGISLAACLALARAPRSSPAAGILVLLLAWMLLQIVPLPAVLVAHLSPYRYDVVEAARAALSQPAPGWISLSASPAATFDALLFVVPAMAAFLAAGEMARWFTGRLWLVVAPVLVLAFLEAVLGLFQYSLMRTGEGATFVSGTYASYDHYSGLLEIALPVAIMAAVTTRDPLGGVAAALRTSVLLAVAGCLFMAIVVSLSRMGMVSALAAVACVLAALAVHRQTGRRWLWLALIIIPLLLLASLSTRELLLRFSELTATQGVTGNVRMQIWADTLRVISAYPWTGCGLGAFERGMFQFKTAAPSYTVDFAHNDYLQMTAELGIPGMILLAVLVIIVVGRTLRVVVFLRRSPNWYLACGLLGTLLAIAVHSLADFNLYVPANALVFAWLAGLATELDPGPETVVAPRDRASRVQLAQTRLVTKGAKRI